MAPTPFFASPDSDPRATPLPGVPAGDPPLLDPEGPNAGPPEDRSVEVLCVGTELLLGNILNGNARWIAERLEIGRAHV